MARAIVALLDSTTLLFAAMALWVSSLTVCIESPRDVMARSRAANASLMFLIVLFCWPSSFSTVATSALRTPSMPCSTLFLTSSCLNPSFLFTSLARSSTFRSAFRAASIQRSASALYFDVTRASRASRFAAQVVSRASSSVDVFSLKADVARSAAACASSMVARRASRAALAASCAAALEASWRIDARCSVKRRSAAE